MSLSLHLWNTTVMRLTVLLCAYGIDILREQLAGSQYLCPFSMKPHLSVGADPQLPLGQTRDIRFSAPRCHIQHLLYVALRFNHLISGAYS